MAKKKQRPARRRRRGDPADRVLAQVDRLLFHRARRAIAAGAPSKK
jgi:hypothetical protein